MLRYVLKRLLWAAATLWVISLLAFGLSRLAPGDPVDLFHHNELNTASGRQDDVRSADATYLETARRLRLDKPPFYLTLTSSAYPDTLHRIVRRDRREAAAHLIARYGNWPAIEAYFSQVDAVGQAILALPDSVGVEKRKGLWKITRQLLIQDRPDRMQDLAGELVAAVGTEPALRGSLRSQVEALSGRIAALPASARQWPLYLPVVYWYGTDNQYHLWLSRFLRGDFGISYQDARPVGAKIRDYGRWTLLINLLAIVLTYGIAIPLGVRAARRRGQAFDRWSTVVLFVLYSLPVFWVATLLILFFTTPEYGMKLFPASGLGDPFFSGPWWERWLDTTWHLVLPVVCLTYNNLAFVARQVRGSMVQELGQDYVRTAWAKGLDGRAVVWRHAFRNALFPLITLFGSILPASIAGSVVVENIFGIPGMGDLAVRSLLQQDWPVVYTVLMITALLTVCGILLADLLYLRADPRIKF